MGPLVRIKEAMNQAVESGRSKVGGVRRNRQRSQLLRALGEARFAKSKGVQTSDAEMERIIEEIDALDEPAGSEAVDPG